MKKLMFGVLVLFAGCGSDGKTGPQGAKGDAGPAGAAGVSGQPAKVSYGFFCSKVQAGLVFTYRVDSFTSADALVTCSVSGNSNQSSSTIYYLPTQNGITTFACIATYDGSGAATSGYWSFATTSGSHVATYNDTGDAQDGSTAPFASGDCTTF